MYPQHAPDAATEILQRIEMLDDDIASHQRHIKRLAQDRDASNEQLEAARRLRESFAGTLELIEGKEKMQATIKQ